MKEGYTFPPPACAALCRNAMNEVCIEDCAPEGQGKFFERDRKVTILDVSTEATDHLHPKLQFKIVKAKQDILIEHLQGDIYIRP